MQCEHVIHQLDDYLDLSLDQDEMASIRQHIGTCTRCHGELEQVKRLRSLLHALPFTGPSEGFFEQAMEKARRHAEQQKRRKWTLVSGGALAAGFVLVFAVGLMLPNGQQRSPLAPLSQETASQTLKMPGISVALGEVRNVSLSIDSAVALNDVVFSIDLPSGFELSGFPKQTTVRWQGKLEQGKNLLELPIIAHQLGGGVIKASIEHGGKHITYRLNMDVGRSPSQSESQKVVHGV